MAIQTHTRAITPQDPAPPESARYGIGMLEVVPVFRGRNARADYRAYNDGTQAPPFNPKQTIKRWYIVSDTSLELTLFDGTKFVTATYAPEELARINLPGSYDYPAQGQPAPSGAYYLLTPENSGGTVPFATKEYLPPDGLSLYADAVKLSKQLIDAGYSAGAPTEQAAQGVYAVQYEVTEPRRLWTIPIGDSRHNVAMLLRMRNASGVGAPGKWSTPQDSASPVWFPLVGESGEFSVAPEEPVPVRKLTADEALVQTPFDLMIENRRFAPTTGQSPAPSDARIETILNTVVSLRIVALNIQTVVNRIAGFIGATVKE